MIALRTQQIVAHESGVASTVDPLAGSYYVEAMTDQIEKEATDYIEKIDNMGGVVPAIEAGYIQGEIQTAAYKFEMELEANERIVVGVNKYQVKEDTHKNLLKIDMKVQEDQIKFLQSVRAQRNNDLVKEKLAALKKAAEGDANLMPFILDAVRVYGSVGEISNTMREVFGEYRENVFV